MIRIQQECHLPLLAFFDREFRGLLPHLTVKCPIVLVPISIEIPLGQSGRAILGGLRNQRVQVIEQLTRDSVRLSPQLLN